MKTSLKSVLFGSALGLAVIAAPQAALAKKKDDAPAAGPVLAQGIGIANPDYIVASSAAYKYSDAQRQTHFKAYYDQVNQRKAQITQQIQPLYDKLDKDSQNPKADQAALQKQAIQIRQLEQAGTQELQQIMQPVALSDAYVKEQIVDKFQDALTRAKARRNITLVLDGRSVIDAADGYDMDKDIIAELDALIPVPQLDPPQGWMPRAQREAAAAQAAQQGGAAPAPAAAPAGAPAPRGSSVSDDGRGN